MNLALNSSTLASTSNNDVIIAHAEYPGDEEEEEEEEEGQRRARDPEMDHLIQPGVFNEQPESSSSSSQSPQQHDQQRQRSRPNTANVALGQLGQLGPALHQVTGIEPSFSFQTSTELFPGFHPHQSPLLHYPQLGAFGGFRGGGGGRRFSSATASKGATDLQMQVREAKPYKCTHCVKSFANSSYLSQHMRIHLGIKPFGPCQFCGKKFTQLSHLQQHIRTHTGEKPYKCQWPSCEKAFSQLSNLQSHSRCHQSDKPFKCNSCYKCFTDETALLDHIPKHKESKHLKVHICPFCGKSYTQSTYLAKHMTKHSDRRERGDLRLRSSDFPDGLDQLAWNGSGRGVAGEVAGQGHSICPIHGVPDGCVDGAHLAFGSFPQTTGYPTQNTMQAMVNDPSAFTRLAGLAASTFSRSLQGGHHTARTPYFYENSLKTASDTTRHNLSATGFNMITPLENIQRYSQQGAAAAAAEAAAAHRSCIAAVVNNSPSQQPQSQTQQQYLGGMKRDMY